jgi:predicted RNase H-like HicB family nuclease
MRDFAFDTHIFKEGDAHVAYAPALDVSSCGATDEEARRNIRDAVRGFLAASADMGTLDEICTKPATTRKVRSGAPRNSCRWIASR